MLSIGKISGTPGGAAKYYASGDYYSKDSDAPSRWFGAGAKRLKLEGQVATEDLTKTLSGILPKGHKAGWEKANSKHHPGWDLTFSAPKGVSILSIVGGDKRLHTAHDNAVERALTFVETYAHVRLRGADSKITYRHTGNLVAARFTEYFSRTLDPHLHTHTPVSNMTYDKERGRWYALDSGALYKIKMAAGQVYRNELAVSCKTLGYKICRNAETGLFDIKDIPSSILEAYSARRQAIVDYAQKRGWASAANYALATLLTRPNKAKTDHMKVLDDLAVRAGPAHHDLLSLIEKSRLRTRAKDVGQHPDIVAQHQKLADKAARHGLSHLTNREAVVEHGHIIGEALKADIGRMRIGDIEAALKRQEQDKQYQRAGYQTGGKHLYHGHTTDSSIAWETRLEHQVIKQRETVWPLASIEATQTHLENSSLTDKQKAAARFVLRSRDRSVIVAGVAGSGKSHLVRTIKKAAPYRQYLALAPTATAAVDLGTSAGIPAGTLAEFLQTGGQKVGRNTLLFVDEASMSSTRQTVRLLEIADKRKARIVFLGDTKQLDAIEQGKPFGLLIKMGLRSVFIDQSFRQKNPSMHTLVQAARDGKIKQVFATLGDRLEEYEAADLANQVAERWVKDPNRESIQIAALENSSRISTNAALRHRLQEEGLVSKADHPFKILSSKGLTPALLSLADYYKPGDIIVFHLGHAKLGAGKDDKFRVLKSKGGKVQMEHLSDGKKITFDPGRTRKKGMTLYHEQKRNLSLGDKIQWRQNLKNVAGIKNGHTGTIEEIKDGKATIAFDHGPKRTLDLREHQCWDHGYVITTYKQQGKTTPVNWIIANTEKAGEITQKSLYVSLTRAEKSVRLFTDNAQKLKHALHMNPGGKTSSLHGLGTQKSLHLPISPSPTSRYTNLIDALHPALRMIAANLYDTIKEAKPRRNLAADSILMKDDKASIITAARVAEKGHMKQHADMRER